MAFGVGCTADFDTTKLRGPRGVIAIFGHGPSPLNAALRVTGRAVLLPVVFCKSVEGKKIERIKGRWAPSWSLSAPASPNSKSLAPRIFPLLFPRVNSGLGILRFGLARFGAQIRAKR